MKESNRNDSVTNTPLVLFPFTCTLLYSHQKIAYSENREPRSGRSGSGRDDSHWTLIELYAGGWGKHAHSAMQA